MREVSCIYLETIDGQKIRLELVDVQYERIEEKLVQIVGKSYDIFAVPVRAENERGR
jgi:hypothetical protein